MFNVYAKAKQGHSFKVKFETLEEAIDYCKTHKCKYGHEVTSYGPTGEFSKSGLPVWGDKVLYED